ncbi:hypothetical protein COOONC_07160 [Cooperia oncophora]
MEDEEEEDVNLKPGFVVESSKASYVIVKLLGEGGFGAVYKVHDKNDKRKEYAMKVEKKLESRRHSKLKMEVYILDFGIARKILNPKGELKAPRQTVRFKVNKSIPPNRVLD